MLFYYNPHVDDFIAEPIQFRLLRRRPLKKYGFLFDKARAENKTVYAIIDGTASGLIPETIFQKMPLFVRKKLSILEFYFWKKINKFGDEVERVEPSDELSSDILLAFSYKAATGDFSLRRPLLSRYHTVVFHLSHYFVSSKEKADNLRTLDNLLLAGDSDIREIPYFKKYFSWYKRKFLVLPFAVADRFVANTSWDIRDSRVVATGSFHDLRKEQPAYKYQDFISTTGSTTYHPIRKEIFNSDNILEAIINTKISCYREYGKSFLNRFLNHFQVSQKKYFSIDIVDLYNNHKYAVVGEELSGFPALGSLEAMACGCVLFVQPQYYQGLNLVSGQHFFSYDGGLNSLIEKISITQMMSLESMSKKISEKAKEEFNSQAVYTKWMSCLFDIEYENYRKR